jgi:hypothetical protein
MQSYIGAIRLLLCFYIGVFSIFPSALFRFEGADFEVDSYSIYTRYTSAFGCIPNSSFLHACSVLFSAHSRRISIQYSSNLQIKYIEIWQVAHFTNHVPLSRISGVAQKRPQRLKYDMLARRYLIHGANQLFPPHKSRHVYRSQSKTQAKYT